MTKELIKSDFEAILILIKENKLEEAEPKFSALMEEAKDVYLDD